jgi:hypothetical protein
MSTETEQLGSNEETQNTVEYEAPAIETVMTSEELTREVHYAGATDFTVPIG